MLSSPAPFGPALGLVETASIARGIYVCDALTKRAPVRLLWTEALTPGKYVILFDGDEASVEEAFRTARETAKESLVGELFLPQPHAQLWDALHTVGTSPTLDSVGVVETLTIAATLTAADAAVKAADVTLFQLHLAKGIGGKGWFALTGSLESVQAAVEAATRSLGAGLLAGVEVIARPDEALAGQVL